MYTLSMFVYSSNPGAFYYKNVHANDSHHCGHKTGAWWSRESPYGPSEVCLMYLSPE